MCWRVDQSLMGTQEGTGWGMGCLGTGRRGRLRARQAATQAPQPVHLSTSITVQLSTPSEDKRNDLAWLGLGPANPSASSVVVVAQIGEAQMGLVVDAVSDILTLTEDNMQPTPDIANEAAKAYARGILAIEGRMICLIELDALFPHTESEAA